MTKHFECPYCGLEADVPSDVRAILCDCGEATLFHVEHEREKCELCQRNETAATKCMSRIACHFQFLGDDYIPRETQNYVMEQLRLLLKEIR